MIKEFRTEVRCKKRRRKEVFQYDGDDQWLSFSSGAEDENETLGNAEPGEERGNSRFNFPNFPKTDIKKQHIKFFATIMDLNQVDDNGKMKIKNDCKMRKLNS